MAAAEREVKGNATGGWPRLVTLRDGATLSLRPLTPADRAHVEDLIRRCSPETLRRRFLQPIKSVSDQVLDQLLDVDGTRRVALAVTQGAGAAERIVAVGRYHLVAGGGTVAEVSFLVEDGLQGRGIGQLLLAELAEVARAHGVTHFCADTLSDNRAMLSVFAKSGYPLTSRTSSGVTRLKFPIMSEPTP
jgi:GNAT superfamily N-acetyltransferase